MRDGDGEGDVWKEDDYKGESERVGDDEDGDEDEGEDRGERVSARLSACVTTSVMARARVRMTGVKRYMEHGMETFRGNMSIRVRVRGREMLTITMRMDGDEDEGEDRGERVSATLSVWVTTSETRLREGARGYGCPELRGR